MGIISYVLYGSLILAIIGMGAGAYIESVGNGVQIVTNDPFVQDTAKKVQDYTFEKGSEIGKEILSEAITQIEGQT